MGGKPSRGTSKDMRLKRNKTAAARGQAMPKKSKAASITTRKK